MRECSHPGSIFKVKERGFVDGLALWFESKR